MAWPIEPVSAEVPTFKGKHNSITNYDNETDQFIIRDNDEIIIRFKKSNGLYCSYVTTSEALASVHNIFDRNENDEHVFVFYL